MLKQKQAWDEIEAADAPVVSGSGLRQFLSGEKMTVARFRFAAGTILAEHLHENEQFSMVLEGTMEFNIEGNDARSRFSPARSCTCGPTSSTAQKRSPMRPFWTSFRRRVTTGSQNNKWISK